MKFTLEKITRLILRLGRIMWIWINEFRIRLDLDGLFDVANQQIIVG